jgi:hypothetical protein
MLKQERAFPKLLPQSWKHRIIYNVIVALRFPFTGTKGPSPNHEKQPQTIIYPLSNFTVGTMHWGKYCSPGIRQTQISSSDCQMVKLDSSLQRKRVIANGDIRLVCGCSVMETHFMKLPTNSYCANIASRGSLASEDR